MKAKQEAKRITSGHTNGRRTIWDIVTKGDAGGGKPLFHLSYFTPVHAGAQIGGAREGFGHYHALMWETYIILAGSCVMSLRDIDGVDAVHERIEVRMGDAPIKVEVRPRMVHRLIALEPTILLIAATAEQTPDDTFEAELPIP